ncbi:MAG TPA: prolyl oligopeptidase family serine peptidase, partial [Chthoniobacteraceae bacterium]|nr:prolyl oligopeptidase family serine peptidase [Chthoniobacteraceae bacterium]
MQRLLFVLAFLSATTLAQQPTNSDRAHARAFRDKVEPRWLPGGDSFWYRNDLPDGKKEYVLVDAVKGERRVVDEPPSVPRDPNAALKPRSSRADSSTETLLRFINRSGIEARLFWIDPGGRRQSYGALKAGETKEQHTFEGHVWWIESADGTLLGIFEGEEMTTDAVIEAPTANGAPKRDAKPEQPPRDWRASIKDNNVWIRHRLTGEEVQLSDDGKPDDPYREPFRWSPDGKKFVALQTKPAQERKVWLVESSPADQLQPKLQSYDYLKPGDRIAHPRPRLFDVEKRAQIPVSEELIPNPWSIDDFHWAPDSSRVFFEYNQRGHQLVRIIAVDAGSGEARAIVEEKSATFIDYSQKSFLHWLDATGELIWASERDGWNHLYLYDTQTGAVKTQITSGPWVVRGVERIDAEQRVAWLRVLGVRAGEDPYHFHLARVNLGGSGFKVLTEGDGTHKWDWSPDKRFFIDTWSRVDQPPIIELRRAADGQRMCELERADINALLATGWHGPERFVAQGRDGQTDIHGIIFRPQNFDAAQKYPVIEQIYAGPQDFFVPKAWSRFGGQQALADRGFVVVQIDGMGTNWRSRAFHDMAFKNLKDAGFPDRIAWLKAAAATRPWMDLTRVGVFGGSAGGQNALGAMLFHGDFYKAAVADCGCHDNRMDKIWWNEQWMSWPVGPHYAEQSNVTQAHRLKGKLLLMVGEMDRNVDPASTMQVVNALIKADKDF